MSALGKVRATDDTRTSVEYGAPARIKGRGDRYRFVEGYGFGMIAPTTKVIDEEIGLDPRTFDEAIVAGQPPRWGAVLWGDYDVAAVDDRLAERGIDRAEVDGGTRWKSGKDFEIDFQGPFVGVVQTNQFNAIRTAEGSFAYGPSAAGVDWVTDPGDETLADDERIKGFAWCLGDVVAAMIQEQAAGAREDGTEVICLDGDIGTVEKALGGDVPSTRQPWDELLPDWKVEEAGGLVRVTAPANDDLPVGRALRAMSTRDLQELG